MSWIQTFTGRKFFPLGPRVEDVALGDIAHALAMKCRFGGHCRQFYSVAEHSVRVSRIVPAGLAMSGLLHDAGEAYLADVGRPVKPAVHLHVGGRMMSFDEVEERVLEVVTRALGVGPVVYATIAEADTILLATEARDLMSAAPEPWELGVEPLAERIVPVGPAEAEAMFLRRYAELRGMMKK